MSKSNTCWGIEIGAYAIKALKVQADDDGGRVLEYANIPHPKVLSTPGVDANDAIRVSLGTLISQHDLSNAALAVSVPGHAAFARFAKLPPVEPKKVPDIVRFEAMQQIPFPLEEVEWDYQTFVSQDSPDVEVGIFAIHRDRINERLALLQDVGIVPDVVTLSPVAVYNALAYDLQFPPETPGTIILDVGTTSTDLVIAEAGRVWIRTFPVGGHHFTDALVKAFQLSYAKAEKLKSEADDSKHARQVFQAMRPVFTDLAQDVQRSIGYYTSLHRDAKLVRLIGVGSTFELPGLRKYLKQQLSLDVFRIEEFKRLEAKGLGEQKAEDIKKNSLQYMTAYGLALQGLDLNRVSANLMPVRIVREAMWKSKVPWFVAAAGLAVAAGAAAFVRPLTDSLAVKSRLPDPIIQRVISEANRLKTQANEAQVTGNAQPDFRAANMLSLLDRRTVYAHIADDLGAMMRAADQRSTNWMSEVMARRTDAPPPPPPAPGPAYTVTRLLTDYIPPAGADTSGGFASGAGADKDADKPRVKLTLEVSTTQPEPQRFMLETLQKWLRDNEKRGGVPYTISATENPWTMEFVRQPDQPGPGAQPQEQPQVIGAPLGSPGSGRRRGGPGVPQDGRVVEGGEVMGNPDDRRGGGGQQPQAGGEDLTRLAPLAELRPTPPGPGPREAKFTLTWHVVVQPPAPADAQKGGTP